MTNNTSSDPIFPDFIIQPARKSMLCAMPLKIVFIPPQAIGIHEDHNPKKLALVLASILKSGYHGPAILTMESFDSGLFAGAKNKSLLQTKKPFEIGVIDGHNRLVACKIFKILDLLRHPYIPVQLIPQSSKLVFAATLPELRATFSMKNIQAINAKAGQTMPADFPYHTRIKLRDGNHVRVIEGQPDMVVELNNLLNLSAFDKKVLEAKAGEIEKYIPVDQLREILSELGII